VSVSYPTQDRRLARHPLGREWRQADLLVAPTGVQRVAPMAPQQVQRARWRSTSPEASGPHRMISCEPAPRRDPSLLRFIRGLRRRSAFGPHADLQASSL
jgi:hypothetical protein